MTNYEILTERICGLCRTLASSTICSRSRRSLALTAARSSCTSSFSRFIFTCILLTVHSSSYSAPDNLIIKRFITTNFSLILIKFGPYNTILRLWFLLKSNGPKHQNGDYLKYFFGSSSLSVCLLYNSSFFHFDILHIIVRLSSCEIFVISSV